MGGSNFLTNVIQTSIEMHGKLNPGVRLRSRTSGFYHLGKTVEGCTLEGRKEEGAMYIIKYLSAMSMERPSDHQLWVRKGF